MVEFSCPKFLLRRCCVTIILSGMRLSGCGIGEEGHPRWVLALLLPVMKHDTLGYLLLFHTPQMWCLKTIDVVLKSRLGEIPCLTLVKTYCILLDGFRKCVLEQKFKT